MSGPQREGAGERGAYSNGDLFMAVWAGEGDEEGGGRNLNVERERVSAVWVARQKEGGNQHETPMIGALLGPRGKLQNEYRSGGRKAE